MARQNESKRERKIERERLGHRVRDAGAGRQAGKLLQVALFYAHICAYYSYARLAYIFI